MTRMLTTVLLCAITIAGFASPWSVANIAKCESEFFAPTSVNNAYRVCEFMSPLTTMDEGFEGDTLLPTGWTTVDEDGNGMAWFVYQSPGTAHAGANSAGTLYDMDVPNDDWLITPPITVEDSGHVLVWWAASQETDPIWLESYQVWISTSTTDISSFTDSIYGETDVSSEWGRHVFSLAPYFGQTIYIAWRCTSDDDFILKIDDVHIGDPPPYAFSLEPNFSGAYCAPDCEISYPVRIINQGTMSDQYGVDFAEVGDWPVQILDETGSSPVTITDMVAPGDTAKLMVKFVVAPTITDTTADAAAFEATSIGDGTLIGSIVLQPVALPGVALPYTNSFDTDAENWEMNQGNTGEGMGMFWLVDTAFVGDTAFIGSMPYTRMAYQESALVDIWYYTPLIDLTGVTSAHISFDEMSFYGIYTDYHGIWASTAGATPEHFLSDWIEVEELATAPEEVYTQKTVSLDDFAGEKVFIAFRYQGFWADIWFIDDVEIAEGAAVDDIPHIATDFKLTGNLPNPFNAATTIRTNAPGEGTIEIFDISGHKVRNLPIDGDRAIWNGSSDTGDELPCGVYLYRLSGTNDVSRMIYLK